jgi:hypothetical protein
MAPSNANDADPVSEPAPARSTRLPGGVDGRAGGGCACIFVTRNPDEFDRTHAAFLRRGPSVHVVIPICGVPPDADARFPRRNKHFPLSLLGLRRRAPELNARWTPRGGGGVIRSRGARFPHSRITPRVLSLSLSLSDTPAGLFRLLLGEWNSKHVLVILL